MTPHSLGSPLKSKAMDERDNWLKKPTRNKYARMLRERNTPFTPKVHRTEKDKSSGRLRAQDIQALVSRELDGGTIDE